MSLRIRPFANLTAPKRLPASCEQLVAAAWSTSGVDGTDVFRIETGTWKLPGTLQVAPSSDSSGKNWWIFLERCRRGHHLSTGFWGSVRSSLGAIHFLASDLFATSTFATGLQALIQPYRYRIPFLCLCVSGNPPTCCY